MAAASVSRTLRASVRSAIRLEGGVSIDARFPIGVFDDGVNGDEPPEQGFEQVEAERVLCVAAGARRLVVHLEKHAVYASGHARRRQRLDVLGEAGGHAA